MTTAEVKALLGITVATYDAQITVLIPEIEAFVRIYADNKFLAPGPKLTSTAISFSASTLTMIVTNFLENMEVYIEGSASNDSMVTLGVVGASTINIPGVTFVTESAGEKIIITRTLLPASVKLAVAKLVKHGLFTKEHLKSKKLGDGSETYTSGYPDSILELIPRSVSSV